MDLDADVIVVGAGLGGLLLACELGLASVDVALLCRDEVPDDPPSATLDMQALAALALRPAESLLGPLAALARFAGVTLHPGCEVYGVHAAGDQVWVNVRGHGCPSSVGAHFVAGCDGAHSAVAACAGLGRASATARRHAGRIVVVGSAAHDGADLLTEADEALTLGAALLAGIDEPALDPLSAWETGQAVSSQRYVHPATHWPDRLAALLATTNGAVRCA